MGSKTNWHSNTVRHEEVGPGSQRYQNLPGRGVADGGYRPMGKGKDRKAHSFCGARKARRGRK